MRRLFFSLYAVVALALLGFVLAIPWLLENALHGELMRSSEQSAAAAQYLFEQELRAVPPAEWPSHVDTLADKFGYELKVRRLQDIQASTRNLRRLEQGLVALADPGSAEDLAGFMLLPLRGSDYVVQLYTAPRAAERARRAVDGFYYLLEKLLAQYPEAKWAAVLSEFTQRYDITMQRLTLSDFTAPDELGQLRAGKIVGRDIDQPNERYFKRLNSSDQVLQIGPFPRYFLESIYEGLTWVVLGIVIAVALYLWVRPLWRDMLALDQGAVAIGLGEFDARVGVSASSPVRELANTFNGMAQRVQQLIGAQKEMADAVSHELCTPISRLRFGVEMLSNASTPPDQQRYLRGILRDIDELDGLVDEALTYSKLTHSAHCLTLQDVELTDWLRALMQDAQRSAGAIRLSSEITTASASAEFDARLMARALSNVVRNALRYARSAVKVTVSETPGYLDLTVEDDGPGIPPEQREAIFEPFYRIDRSRQRESGGYGLGLAIVKRICERHRARLTVSESPLGGARFHIRLPMSG